MGKTADQAGIVIYWDTFELLDELEPEEAQEMIGTIYAYSRYGTEPDFADNRVMRIAWKSIKAGIDRNLEKYEQTRAARSAAGKASAEKRAAPSDNEQNSANVNKGEQASTNLTNVDFVEQSSTNGNTEQQKQLSNIETERVLIIEREKEKERSIKREKKERESAAPAAFIPPTQAEVAEYCRERGNSIDPVRFIAVNSAKGWKIGNTQVSDWKSLIHAWEKTQFDQPNREPDKPDSDAYVSVTAADMAKIAQMRERIAKQNNTGS